MIGPVFRKQKICDNPDEANSFVNEAILEAKSKNCGFTRVTYSPSVSGLVLLEGWLEDPRDRSTTISIKGEMVNVGALTDPVFD